MDIKTIKRIILRLFPEFTAELHLPQLARIVAVPELPATDCELSDRFYPRYAVDVVLLDAELVERSDVGILQAVPLPVYGAGNNAGIFAPASVGALVEIAFHRGIPSMPFIRTVLGLGFELPAIKNSEFKIQSRVGVYQQIDENGNFISLTDKMNQLKCKTNEMIANQTWIGSESENALNLLSELMTVVSQLAATCARHTHTSTQAGMQTSSATQANEFEDNSASASGLKNRLDPITK